MAVPAEPLPEAIDEPEEQDAWRMRYDAILSTGTLEKVMLVGLVAVIFSQMLPDFTGSTPTSSSASPPSSWSTPASPWPRRVAAGPSGRRRSPSPPGCAMNVGLVLVADPLLGRHNARLDGYDTIFFLSLISLITTLHDRWRPVHEVREVL